MVSASMLGDRYRIEEPPIGQGGMGVVYKAFDNVTKRFVAVKTLRGEVDSGAIHMFQREWSQLAQLSHPNIVDVLDIGELVEKGGHKPYFVMPLLKGATLDTLMKNSGQRLSPERAVDIISQTCRGLQAAHDRGLVHRDLKPSNLFVMADDTVKIIDFGIVHLADAETRTGVRGTLQYMAPEQLDMKPANARSDIFSLAVVCYEVLTGRKPFDRGTAEEVVDAIRSHMPPPASEFNPSTNDQVSRTVQKAMAKQPYHRFSSAREFSDILQRSLRNEHIELFDKSKIQPRLNRIKKALTDGDSQLAIDMLDELESEGNVDPEISVFRIRADQAARSRKVYQLIEGARARMEEQEYPLALQNVQRAMDLDPGNCDALSIKGEIDRQRGASQIEKWLQIAQQHFDNKLFGKARQALDEIKKVDPSNRAANDLLAAISGGEEDLTRITLEKKELYDSALKGYRNGDISSALSKLQKVVDLGKLAPGHPNTEAQYLALYEQIRSERDELHNSYVEGKKAVESQDFARAIEICQDVMRRRPGDPLFKALSIEIEERQRQDNSATIAQLHRRIEAEADPEKKVAILNEAVARFPDEQTFSQSLKLSKERRDLVSSIVARARQYESQKLFVEASNQWDVLRNIYPQYPGLDYELQRLARKQEEHGKEEVKAVWVDRIDRALMTGEYSRAEGLLTTALLESPDDGELIRLKEQIRELVTRNNRARALAEEGQQLADAGDKLGAAGKLRAARELDNGNAQVRAALISVLIEHAQQLVGHDWRAALPFAEEALKIDATDPGAVSLSRRIDDKRQQEHVEWYLMEARDLQTRRKLKEAQEKVEEGLREHPNEFRLLQLRNTLRAAGEPQQAADFPSDRPETGAGRGLPLKDSSAPAGEYTELFVRDSAASPHPTAPLRDEDEKIAIRPGFAARQLARTVEPAPSAFPLRMRVAAVLAVLLLVGLVFVLTRPSKPVVVAQRPPLVLSPVGDTALSVSTPPDAKVKTPVAGQTAPATPSLPQAQPAPGPARTGPVSFSFSSEPTSARVVVDEDPALTCVTPCELPLSRGRHVYIVSAAGFRSSSHVVQVPEKTNSFESLRDDLTAVRLISTPAGCALTVDGEAKGQTPTTVRLRAGRHKITVTKDGRTGDQTIDVGEDDAMFTIQLTDAPPATPATAPQ